MLGLYNKEELDVKGTIIKAAYDLVKEKYGKEILDKIVTSVKELPSVVSSASDYPGELLDTFVKEASSILNIPVEQLVEDIGEFFATNVVPQSYSLILSYYSTAEDFLMNIPKVHEWVVANVPGARPPDIRTRKEGDIIIVYNLDTIRKRFVAKGAARGVLKVTGTRGNIRLVGSELHIRLG